MWRWLHAERAARDLAIGVVTLSQRKLQERGGRWLELVSGVVVGVLGLLLLFAPELLAWQPS